MTRRLAICLLLAGTALTRASLIAIAQRPARPERIVSLIPAVTEMMYAMGDGARVAAVSNYDLSLIHI